MEFEVDVLETLVKMKNEEEDKARREVLCVAIITVIDEIRYLNGNRRLNDLEKGLTLEILLHPDELLTKDMMQAVKQHGPEGMVNMFLQQDEGRGVV